MKGVGLGVLAAGLLVMALDMGAAGATQADSPTPTAAGTHDGGGPAVLVAVLSVALLAGVTTGVVVVADRMAWVSLDE